MFGSGEAAAVGAEFEDLWRGVNTGKLTGSLIEAYLAALPMNLADRLDGIEVIDARINPNFIHDNNTRLLHLALQLAHSGRYIACSDHVRLAFNGSFDDAGVPHERYE